MAKQTSIITLNGKVGGISFYKTRDGHFAREKGGVSKARIMTDPRFARTRENLQEFNENIKAVKLLQDTIRPLTLKSSDSKLHQRLVREMMKVLKSDTVNPRGGRKVSEGDWDLLKGTELNARATLSGTLRTEISITNTAADFGVDILAFLPSDFLVIPDGSSHFRVFVGGASMDLTTGDRSFQIESTAIFPINQVTPAIALNIAKAGLTENHKVFILGVEFLQVVNGQEYAMNNGAHNAAVILAVEKA